MSRPIHRAWRQRILAMLTAGGMAALIATLPNVASTEAAWTDREYARGTFAAGILNPPVANGCTISGKKFTPAWTPAPAPSVAAASYRYRLYWKPLLGSETLVVDWTTVGAARQFSYTIPSTILQAGSYRYQVQSITGTWTSDPRTGSTTVVALLGIISISGCSWQ